jgi:hypothetical protein
VTASECQPLLEVVHTFCFAQDCGDFYAWRVFANGSVVFEGNIPETGNPEPARRKLQRVEKRLSADQLAEIVGSTEKPDFLKASKEYVPKRVADGGAWITITYRKEKLEKQVRIYNYDIANEMEKATLPHSVRKIIDLSNKVLRFSN